jgi:hypothetical protein
VDINQTLAGGKNQRYFIAREDVNANTYWRIYCKTENQNGAQGVQYSKGAIKCYSFTQWAEYDMPGGYYIDMTSIIQSTREFERIKAQSNWANSYNKTEWWHFQYALNKQDTFSDELELVGYTEDQLRRAGWSTDANLDHKPG